jgi:hypothetical protein
MTAKLFEFPLPAAPPPRPKFPAAPPPEQDVGLWEASVDAHGVSPTAREARALIACAPHATHPLIGYLRKIAGVSNDQ